MCCYVVVLHVGLQMCTINAMSLSGLKSQATIAITSTYPGEGGGGGGGGCSVRLGTGHT